MPPSHIPVCQRERLKPEELTQSGIILPWRKRHKIAAFKPSAARSPVKTPALGRAWKNHCQLLSTQSSKEVIDAHSAEAW